MPRRLTTFILLIGFCLSLAACSALPGVQPQTSTAPNPTPFVEPSPVIGQADGPVASLYFLSPTKTSLVVKVRPIVVRNSEQNKAYEVLNELAAGPSDHTAEPVLPGGTAIEWLEISQNIATVSFSAEWNELDDYGRFVARAAVVDTLTEMENIRAVNLLVQGRAMHVGGVPVGAMIRQSSRDLDLLYEKAARNLLAQGAQPKPTVQPTAEEDAQQTAEQSDYAPRISLSSQPITRRMVLYFPDTKQGLLLAEKRAVTLRDEAYAAAVIEELATGPSDLKFCQAAIPSDTRLHRPPILEQTDGKYTLNLDFTHSLASAFANQPPERVREAVASLVLSLTGFVPQVDYVRLLIEGEPYAPIPLPLTATGEHRGYSRADFMGMVGNTITLYFSTDGEQSGLRRVLRTVPQNTWHQAATRLSELSKGEKAAEDAPILRVWPQMQDPADNPTVTGVKGDTVYVNLPAGIIQACEGMNHWQERAMIYGIVNTLTEMQGIRRVRFQSDGKLIEQWPGLLSINSAFVRNPGLILTED